MQYSSIYRLLLGMFHFYMVSLIFFVDNQIMWEEMFQVGQVDNLTSQAISISLKSVSKIENNYIYKTGTGVAVHNSDISCSRWV